MFGMTTAVTGAAQTGFTTPGYTLTADNAVDVRSKQSAVTALTGTQAGVVAHSVNAPFTISVRRPSILKTLAKAVLNGLTGQYSKVPYNEYVILTRKAAQINASQWFVNEYRTSIKIAAGSETYDLANIKGGVSAHVGFLNGNSSGITDTLSSAII